MEVNGVVGVFVICLLRVAAGETCYLQAACVTTSNSQLTIVHTSDHQCRGTVGSAVVLHCSYNYSDVMLDHVTYQWEKGDKMLTNRSVMIEFDPFHQSDAGDYQCKAFSDDYEVLCGWISLITAPFAGKDSRVNNNTNYNCSYVQEIHVWNGCDQLIVIDVGGYPVPNITWFVNGTMATNDNQVLLTIVDYTSAFVDVQLWSLFDYKDILVTARNAAGSISICVWRNTNDHNKPPLIHFNQSVLPRQLEEGARDTTVITCPSNTYIGDFYICYSKSLSDLESLVVGDEHCCLCSNDHEELMQCYHKFPNWRIEYNRRGNISTWLLNLQTVDEDNSAGFYQCRVYELFNYPCKRRYGSTYNCTVCDDSSLTMHSILLITFIASGCAAGILIFLIIICIICMCMYHRRRRKKLNSIEDTEKEEDQPLLGSPLKPSSDNGPQRPVEETGVQNDCTAALVSSHYNHIQASRTDYHNRHKVHVMHFDLQDIKQWVYDRLTEMLRQMNVEEEYAIAGRCWLSEGTRMIKRGYKVIVLISRNTVTTRFEIMLYHIIFRQNRQACFIPILFDCTLDDLHDELQAALRPYVILRHNDVNLYDRLRQAIYE